MANVRILLKSPLSQKQMEAHFLVPGNQGLRYTQSHKIINFFRGLQGGERAASVDVLVGQGDGVDSSATVTVASNAASSVTINGSTLTGGTNYVIAGQSASQVAANIAAAITASSLSTLRAVSASAVGAVVTIVANEAGTVGNLITLAATGAATASAANLSGGVDPTVKLFKFNV